MAEKKRINTRAKGDRLERLVKNYYTSLGGEAYRSSGSKGRADVVVFHNGFWHVFQIKANKRPPKKEMDDLRAAKYNHMTRKWLIVIKDGRPDPADWVKERIDQPVK